MLYNFNKKNTAGDFRGAIIVGGLVVILILVILIIVNVSSCVSLKNEQEAQEIRLEELKGFPVTINVDKKFKSTDIDWVISKCRMGDMSYQETLNNQLSALATATEQNKLSSFGQLAPEQEELSKLMVSLSNFEDNYKGVFSFIAFDLNSNSGFYYMPDFEIPTASTIKLPFVASALSQNPGSYQKNYDKIANVLKYSDNDSYYKLRSLFGTGGLANWCETTGIEHNMCKDEYPEIATARDMTKLWFKTFEYMKTSDCSDSFMSLMVDSKCSIISQDLSKKHNVYSKAGWWDGPDETTKHKHYDGLTADGALVDDQKHPYILFFFCDKCILPEDVDDIMNDIDAAHDSLFEQKLTFNTPEELNEYYEAQAQAQEEARSQEAQEEAQSQEAQAQSQAQPQDSHSED